MDRKNSIDKDLAALDELIEEITTDAYGDDEQLWAFRQVIEDDVTLPADGFVIGEPVLVVEIDYGGNTRRGLTAKCRREDGSVYVVAASDVTFPERSVGARYVAAYRRWLCLDPYPGEAQAPVRRKRKHKATDDDLDLSRPVELIALAVKESVVRCRLMGSDRVLTLRASGLWDVAPGEIVTVAPRKQWRYANNPYLSGEIVSSRLDVSALGLVPLKLQAMGTWNPEKEYWGEEDEPIEEWAKPIIARGERPAFEMEQVLPGADPDELSGPIIDAVDLKDAGNRHEAVRLLMELCESDLRCLDAHAHLGHFVFDSHPQKAIRHYEVGLHIGELSLPAGFDGALPWGHVDNRPFLRCLHGYGLCLWRLKRFAEAALVFERMLWLNPSDNQGIRFLIDDVRAGNSWRG
ncbi:MAG: cytoplasmic protein, partial [Proteobacteria bacterium]|nr:cytoplasmic protein [Pseudomonadota bacterium]